MDPAADRLPDSAVLIRNTAANLAGQLLYPLLALALVPLYLRTLGLEGYGFIGLMTAVVSLLAILSRGLGGGLQREVARRIGSADAGSLRRLLRSMELAYWAVGLGIFAVLAALALLAGPSVIEARTLPASSLRLLLVLLALRVSVTFPHSVYQAVFIGTERQVLGAGLNAAHALSAAAAAAGAVVLTESVAAFYISETVVAAVFLVVFRRQAFGALPSGDVRFDRAEIAGLVRLSAALMWTSGIGLLIATLDRLVIGVLLPVTALGVYAIAVLGGRAVLLVLNPFLQAVYPGLCRLVRNESLDAQASALLRTAAAVAVVAAGVGVPLAVFSEEALVVWVRDPEVAHAAAGVMSLYVVGSLGVAFGSVFYQWQTAADRTRPAVVFNTLALGWFPPLLYLLVARFGLTGGAAAWAVYGLLAWAVNLGATFHASALPVRHLSAFVRLTAVALTPAVLMALLARSAADAWFSGTLSGRILVAAVAAAAGSLPAIVMLSRHGSPDIFGKIAAATHGGPASHLQS